MSPSSHSRPRRRRVGLAVAGLTLVAVLLPTVGASPAGAATAPLSTTDGLAIRVDENALNGPALDAIENALQPFVDTMIRNGATGPGAPFGSHKALHVSSNVELSLDFLVPGGSRPDGALKVYADIKDVEIRYVMDPVWPFADCNIRVRPDDGTIDAVGKVDRPKLPNAPLTVEPIQATWDDEPGVTSDGVCWTYVVWQAITNWWDGIWDSSNPQSTASKIEAELNDVAQDLIDGLWDDHVVPVVDSLESFGITFNQLRTDDHGLIVTADVDASGGVTIPGFEFFTFNVGNTTDAGVTSNVNTLLAARSQVTVSVHPNVVNQYANAFSQLLNGGFSSSMIVGATAEEFLLPPAERDNFNDNGWQFVVSVSQPYFTAPTGAGGRPQFQMPQATFTFYNSTFGFGQPVATFTGSVAGIDLITEPRAGMTSWGPSVEGPNVDVSATLSSAMPAVTSWNPDGDDLDPFMAIGVGDFNDQILVPFVSLAPIQIGGLSVGLCTTCTRVSGDQRYTEFFTVS